MENNKINQTNCNKCGHLTTRHANFCSRCGTRLKKSTPDKQFLKDRKALTHIMSYYFILLILICTYRLTDIFPATQQSYLVLVGIFICLNIVFVLLNFNELKRILTHPIRYKPLIIMTCGVIALAVLVYFLASFLNRIIFDKDPAVTDFYIGNRNTLLYSFIFISIIPAFFEELAFRGFLINHFIKLIRIKPTIIVTALLFSIIHLSFISFIWLLPVGLIFGYMRLRYRSIWYSIIGHFVYNTVLVIIEFSGMQAI